MRSVRSVVIAAVVAALTVLAPGPVDIGAMPGPEVTEFGEFGTETALGDILRGPGGRMWFTMSDRDTSQGSPAASVNPRLGSITASGAITEHPLPYLARTLIGGAGDTMWISSGFLPFDNGQYAPWPVITQLSASGAVLAEHRMPDRGDGFPWRTATSMALGSDGNVWYTSDHIGRMTPEGEFTRFEIPPGEGLGGPFNIGMTAGIGGDLWWVDADNDRIGRVTTSGQITMYAVPGSQLRSIAVGPDGRMWAVDDTIGARAIVKVGIDGVLTSESLGSEWMSPQQIVAGPDGNMWLAGPQGFMRITPAGEQTDFPSGRLYTFRSIAFSSDGRLWYTRGSHDNRVPPAVGVMPLDPAPTGEFTALTPARILDTRDGTGRGGATTPLGHAVQFDVQITGRGGVPASGVSAVVLNATVTGPTAGSFLSVWPAGRPRPVVSNLNYSAGQTVPNLVTVAVGEDGKVSVFNGAGSTHVIFDVLGYYSSSTGSFGARFVPLDPVRVFDTRDGTGGVASEPIGPGGTLPFDLTGPDLLPETGVSGVVVNVTVTEPTGNGFLTVHPDGVARPLASNLNFVPGHTVANLVTVRLSPAGVARFFNAVGTTHVIADLVGFYTDEVTTNAGRFVPLQPSRVLDTRLSGEPVGPGQVEVMQMLGAGGAPPADVSAVALNVTATQPTAAGYLSVFPLGCDVPFVSSLNFAAGQTVPNLALSAVSVDDGVCRDMDGLVGVFNAVGDVHVIADLFGYFTDDGYVDHNPG